MCRTLILLSIILSVAGNWTPYETNSYNSNPSNDVNFNNNWHDYGSDNQSQNFNDNGFDMDNNMQQYGNSSPNYVDDPSQNSDDTMKNPRKLAKIVKKVKAVHKKSKVRKLESDNDATPVDEHLSVELYPMYYTPVLRSSSFRLVFSSGSMKRRDVNFEINYRMTKFINIYKHPVKVRLNLWKNVYWIKYSRYAIIDQYDVMRALEYRRARLTNVFKRRASINTKHQNMIFLDPQRKYTFTRKNIKKIAKTEGDVKCKLRIRKATGWRLRRMMRAAKLRSKDEQKAMKKKKSKKRDENPSRKLQIAKRRGRRRKGKKSKRTLRQQIRAGRRAMNRLYRRKYIRDTYISCVVR